MKNKKQYWNITEIGYLIGWEHTSIIKEQIRRRRMTRIPPQGRNHMVQRKETPAEHQREVPGTKSQNK